MLVPLLVAVVLVVAAVMLPVGDWTRAFLEWTAGRGAWTGIILAAVWIPAAVLLVPGSLLSLGTGFLLGVAWGTITISIGSTLGATAAFLVGRSIARPWVEERVRERPKFQAVDDAIEREALKIVLLTRLSPIFPYNFLNYAYGVTDVSLRNFVLGSWIGMLPGTVLFAVLGSGSRTLTALAAGERERETLELVLFGLGLAATAAVAFLVTRAARRALAERLGSESGG